MDSINRQTCYNLAEQVEMVNQNLLHIQRNAYQRVGSKHFDSSSFRRRVDTRWWESFLDTPQESFAICLWEHSLFWAQHWESKCLWNGWISRSTSILPLQCFRCQRQGWINVNRLWKTLFQKLKMQCHVEWIIHSRNLEDIFSTAGVYSTLI